MFISTNRITPTLLQAVGAKSSDAKLYAPLLEAARVVPGDDFNTITSKTGLAMLVAQLSYESGYFSKTEEDLTYSVKALREGNRKTYFTQAQADRYGYLKDFRGNTTRKADQKTIANLYYGGRLGNKGVDTDDGWTFRGSGLIQLTGRYNFVLYGKYIGRSPEEAAEYARTPIGAVSSALWFWRANGLVVPASRGDVERCTKIINGGDHGLLERIKLYSRALSTIG